jgi:hypothetical protein
MLDMGEPNIDKDRENYPVRTTQDRHFLKPPNLLPEKTVGLRK